MVGELVICMVVLVSDHRLPPRPNLQSGRPNIIIFFNTPTIKAIHSQSPRFAPTNALKGQPPSAVGSALGINAHNKTRPNGAKTFYWFRLLSLGRIAFALFYILTEFHRCCVPDFHHYFPETSSWATIAALSTALQARQTPPPAPWNARSAYYTIEDKYR